MRTQPPVAGLLYVQAPGHPRAALVDRLNRCGESIAIAADVAEALRLLVDHRYACCLLDLASDRAALTAIRLIRARNPTLPLVGIVDPGHHATAAEAMRAGVAELLPWPFEDSELSRLMAGLRERRGVDRPVLLESRSQAPLFAQSPAMRAVMDVVNDAAATRAGVALMGEAGTGRQLVARTIHARSGAAPHTFVAIDCANQSPSSLERLLFGGSPLSRAAHEGSGHETLTPESAILRASAGTLFLMHLVDAPARVQARLARLLRDREALIEGAAGVLEIDLRLVASFDMSWPEGTLDDRLSRELADRLTVRIAVPPLGRRREDVALLAWHLLDDVCRQRGVGARSFSHAALALVSALPWPGNAPELRGVIDAIVGATNRPVIHLEDVLEQTRLDGAATGSDTALTLREARARFERDCISAMLIRHHGRVGEAAKALGIQRTNLYRKVRQLKVPRALLNTRR